MRELIIIIMALVFVACEPDDSAIKTDEHTYYLEWPKVTLSLTAKHATESESGVVEKDGTQYDANGKVWLFPKYPERISGKLYAIDRDGYNYWFIFSSNYIQGKEVIGDAIVARLVPYAHRYTPDGCVDAYFTKGTITAGLDNEKYSIKIKDATMTENFTESEQLMIKRLKILGTLFDCSYFKDQDMK